MLQKNKKTVDEVIDEIRDFYSSTEYWEEFEALFGEINRLKRFIAEIALMHHIITEDDIDKGIKLTLDDFVDLND